MNPSPKLKNLKPFQKGISGNPNGRPKKIYTILKEHGYSKDDIRSAFGELLFYTPAELESLSKRDNMPIIVLIVAKALKRALNRGDYRIIKDIMEQFIGKASLDLNIPSVEQNKKIQIEIIKTKQL